MRQRKLKGREYLALLWLIPGALVILWVIGWVIGLAVFPELVAAWLSQHRAMLIWAGPIVLGAVGVVFWLLWREWEG